MVIVLAALRVDADRPHVLINQLIVDNFSIFTLNQVCSSLVFYDEDERSVFVLVKAMTVVVDNVDFVKNLVMGLEEKLLAVLKQVHFRNLYSSLSTAHHLVVNAVQRWQEDG